MSESQSLADWKATVLPLFDSLSQRTTYAGASTRLRAVAAGLSADTIGPFVVCSVPTSSSDVDVFL